ncbi:hypothetical protein ACKFKF_16320 [Phormidesmis sp. 146-12]
MDALTGATIAKIAFDEFVKSGAGEIAKKAVGGAIEQLRSTIKARFKGNQKAEDAIEKIEKERSPEALETLSGYLDYEMGNPQFAQTLQQLAQQVTNVGDQTINGDQTIEGSRTYTQTAGRDIFTIEKIEGRVNKLGGS